jgi:hypothetical protein
LENLAEKARETPRTGDVGCYGQQHGSAEDGFAGLTDIGGGEDAIGAFLDPVDNILATKDGGAPSKVGRQRTEWLAKGVGSTDENRRKWERIGRAAVAACWQHVGSIGFGVASALVTWAAVAVVAAWWQHWLPCRFGIVGVGSMGSSGGMLAALASVMLWCCWHC